MPFFGINVNHNCRPRSILLFLPHCRRETSSQNKYTICQIWNAEDKNNYMAFCDMPILKMLGLYLYTLIIGHKSSNMLRILNKLTLYKELQTLVTNNVFLDKKVKTQQQNKKLNIKTLAVVGDWTRDLLHPKRMRYHCTTESTEYLL